MITLVILTVMTSTMTEFVSVSQLELVNRRRKLRQQRRLKALQNLWRSLAVLGLASGLVWFTAQPAWVLRRSEQVMIEGNELLTDQAIQSLLPIPYPQSLLSVKPKAIAEELEAKAPIVEAQVTRSLFPPNLTVQIQERHPVAIAHLSTTPGLSLPGAIAPSSPTQVGLLDEKGLWIPMDSFAALSQPSSMPTLKFIGIQGQYQSAWESLYQSVSRSPVKISEIDWRNPANLILKTELGLVHFGPYTPQFTQQLAALDKMRRLPERVDSTTISYIDLRNPDTPLVQMKEVERSSNPDV